MCESDGERAVETIEKALADEGPLTRVQLRERLGAAGVPTAGQALIHLLFLAAVRGIAVRGPMVGKQHAYVLVRDWLGAQKPVDREQALAELARRYLAGHGPADDRDLARWAGLPLRDARAGLAAIAAELEQRPDGLVDLAKRPPPSRCRRRACSAPTTRCCSAGPRARKSSARTSCWSPSTASSAPSPWSTAAPSPLGAGRRQGDDRAPRQGDEEGRRGARRSKRSGSWSSLAPRRG